MLSCANCQSDPCLAILHGDLIRKEAIKLHGLNLSHQEKHVLMHEPYKPFSMRQIKRDGYAIILPGCVAVASLINDSIINDPKEDVDEATSEVGYPTLNASEPLSHEICAPNPGNLLCQFCKSDPCHTVTYGGMIQEHGSILDHDENPTNSAKYCISVMCMKSRGGLGKEL